MTTTNDMLLVGSVPLHSSEEVLRACGAAIGEFVPCLPDGETGERQNWISYLALRNYSKHPDIETLARPSSGHFDVSQTDYWQFRLKPGVTRLRFEDLGYIDPARDSYAVFRRLRDEGTIPADVRFQVCLPSPYSGVHNYFRHAEDWPVADAAYAEAMDREVQKILEDVPSDDLVIQWDVCVEVLDLCGPGLPWAPEGTFEERFARNVDQFDSMSRAIPEEVKLGFHFCYGTLGGWPMAEYDSLELCVNLANEAVARSGRRVDYLHMPVPRHYDPDRFFAPLENLNAEGARVYLGLVHHTDGVDDFNRRVGDAREHLSDFGVASVCGYGRVAPSEMAQVLELHRACAEALTERARA
jgi:hypothetical protein